MYISFWYKHPRFEDTCTNNYEMFSKNTQKPRVPHEVLQKKNCAHYDDDTIYFYVCTCIRTYAHMCTFRSRDHQSTSFED